MVSAGHYVVSYVFVIWVGRDFWVMGHIIMEQHHTQHLLIVVAITEPLQRSSTAEDRFTHCEHSLVSKTLSQTEVASRGGQELLFIPFNGDSSENLDGIRSRRPRAIP